MRAIKAAVSEYVMALRSAATGELVRWLEGFVRFYAQRRQRDGVADFDDLLIWARDLVRDKPEVRRYFQAKYRCILVDEFQDTDPLQAEMIVRLCAEDGGETDWRGRHAAAGRALRRRRPEAVDLPLPPRRHHDVRRGEARRLRRRAGDRPELPLGRGRSSPGSTTVFERLITPRAGRAARVHRAGASAGVRDRSRDAGARHGRLRARRPPISAQRKRPRWRG